MKCCIESKFQKGMVLTTIHPQFPNKPPEKLKIVDIKLTTKKLWYCFEYLCEREDRSRTWYLEDNFGPRFDVEDIEL